MKTTTKLLLSDANVYKGTFMKLAKETIHGMNDERVREMLNEEALKQDECWRMLSKWKTDQKI
ncbi:hypothetical protein Hanom_Chr14g01270721 [Helianthus anomalus]